MRKQICATCAHFTPCNPKDATAPEGTCGLPEWPGCWPMGYWPNVLDQDFCINGYKANGVPDAPSLPSR